MARLLSLLCGAASAEKGHATNRYNASTPVGKNNTIEKASDDYCKAQIKQAGKCKIERSGPAR
jgi:hypothetical protein